MHIDYTKQLDIYQAANSDPASIRANFVVRKEEFETILTDLLRKQPQDPVQHELILGQRGSGKSSLLRRIEVEIQINEALSTKYIAINLPEEQASIHRLFDLWEVVLDEIASKLHKPKPEIVFKGNTYEYTRLLHAHIHEYLQQANKKAVVLLDNFDRILENFDEDAHLLRETLLNYNDLKIIGGSTRMSEHFWRYDKPFYEFFRRFRLQALSRAEMEALLRHWSKVLELPQLETFIEQQPGKLETIRILTDGLPRTLLLFIRMLIHDTDLQGYEYLRKIMDECTPLYQERLNTLPATHRKIVAQMAFLWEACSAKQLAEVCKLESKLVSAYLKQLDQKGLIETLGTQKRNHLYRIAERFFNMWYIITQGNPTQKRQAKWLSIFLENWYSEQEIRQLTYQHLSTLQTKAIGFEAALLRTKALSHLKSISLSERDEMIELTRQMGEVQPKHYWQLPPTSSEIRQEYRQQIEQKNWNEALKKIEEVEQEDGWKDFAKGNVYYKKEEFDQAESYYLQAIEKGHVGALNNIAVLYENQGKTDQAEHLFLQAIGNGHVNALNNIALLYKNQGKTDQAESYYLQAIEKGHVNALYNIALLYENQGKTDQAEHYYLQAIEKGDVDALNNIAILYENQGKTDQAESYYLQAIEKGEDVYALNNIAMLYVKKGKTDQAEHYYLQAIEKGDVDALNNIAVLYVKKGKTDQAEHYFLQAIENGYVNALYNLAWLFYILNKKPTKSLALIQQYNQQNGDVMSYKDELVIKIWSGAMANTKEQVEAWMQAHLESDSTEDFIKQLLIHHQTQLVYGFFESQEFGKYLKEKYVVLYYATQKRLVPQPENIDLIIPPELFNTVEEIVAHINERQIFYYGK